MDESSARRSRASRVLSAASRRATTSLDDELPAVPARDRPAVVVERRVELEAAGERGGLLVDVVVDALEDTHAAHGALGVDRQLEADDRAAEHARRAEAPAAVVALGPRRASAGRRRRQLDVPDAVAGRP